MKNRTLPYGYCCKDGVIVIESQESKVLKRIFAAYLDGSSMLTIAEQLNRIQGRRYRLEQGEAKASH